MLIHFHTVKFASPGFFWTLAPQAQIGRALASGLLAAAYDTSRHSKTATKLLLLILSTS